MQGINVQHRNFPRDKVHAVQLLDKSILDFAGFDMHRVREGHRERLRRDVKNLKNEGLLISLVADSCFTLHLHLVEDAWNVVRLTTHYLGQLNCLNPVNTLAWLWCQRHYTFKECAPFSCQLFQ